MSAFGTMTVGQTVTLTLTNDSLDAYSISGVTWSASPNTLGTLTPAGTSATFAAEAPGSVAITAVVASSAGSFSKKATLTILPRNSAFPFHVEVGTPA
jgi:hypothetical protein